MRADANLLQGLDTNLSQEMDTNLLRGLNTNLLQAMDTNFLRRLNTNCLQEMDGHARGEGVLETIDPLMRQEECRV